MRKPVRTTSNMTWPASASFRRRAQRGFVLVLMGLLGVGLFGALGTAVDIGRMFIAKNELQNFSDTAALAAAQQLNGSTSGFTNAAAAVAKVEGNWNLGSQSITSYTIEYATASTGPWSTSPGSGAGYIYARVTTPVQMPLYFLPIVTGINSQWVNARAAAGQIGQTTITRGLEPYTIIAEDPSNGNGNFGLTAGHSYDIQWPQFNSTRAGCSTATPNKCFNSPPCANESIASKKLVTQYWGSNFNGYWGDSSNSVILQQVLSGLQLQPVTIGGLVFMTSGNKQAQAAALDTRVHQDGYSADTSSLSTYSASGNGHNGRRLMAIPIVEPTASGTYVRGYASVFLMSNGADSDFYQKENGNAPFCALYVGPYTFSAANQGGSGTAGAFKIELVQ